MSGSTYPTLSSSIFTYIALINHVDQCLISEEAMRHPPLMRGLKACKAKLETYFDQTSSESELYYFSTGMYPNT